MQPNDPQGLNQPGQNQPGQVLPPQPPVSAQPAISGHGTVIMPTPGFDPNAGQPAPLAPQPSLPPAPVVDSAPQSVEQLPADQPVGDQADDVDNEEYDDGPITWVAHEYIHQEKGAMWFFLFAIVIAALIGVSIWTQAWTFTALIVVIAVLVIVFSRRPPRELTYSLTDDGLDIDGKLHKFEAFKAFGVIRDGEEYSVMLIPTQRFQPGISVYFPEEAGEDIVDMLGSRLPMKELKLDAVDRVVRILRL